MKQIGWLWLVFASLLQAFTTYAPVAHIDVNATTAKDLVVNRSHVLIATDNGHAEIFDKHSLQHLFNIKIPPVKDFMGDTVPARVMSVDEINGRFLLLSDSGKGGYSDLYLYEKGKLRKLLGANDKKALIKARFVDKEHILFGYLSNEAALFDIRTKQERYRVQLSESKFSDFALNDEKSLAVFSCESGVLSLIDVQTGQTIKTLEGLNVDNVYRVDFKNGYVAAAGQDRRGAVYEVSTAKGYYIQAKFLIYATALDPKAKQVAFAIDERNGIAIYDRASKRQTAYLKGQRSTLNTIVFDTPYRLYSASDDNRVMVWQLSK